MPGYEPARQGGNFGLNVPTSISIQNAHLLSSVPTPPSLQGASRSRHWTGNMTRTIAHYQRLEQIGEGAYGQVYKARCKQSGRYVALKKLIIQHGGYNGMTPSVIREIKILQRLRHPRLVEMIEVVSSKGVEHLDEHDDHKNSNSRIIDSREGYKGNLFLVLEYVSHDLMALLDIRYQFTEVQIKCIFKQLLEALEYMHSQKYLHRDLKPANILIDSHHRLKLADFGLARNIEPQILDKLHDRRSTQELTNKVVTVMYRPPEILLGATRYGYAVDMWSAGCILAELMLGKTLLPGKVELEQLQLIFDLLGTPTISDGLSNLKLLKTGEVKIEKAKKSRLRDKYMTKMSLAALNLLEKLLELDPNKRLNASRAKDARWFKTEPRVPDFPEQLGLLQLGDGQGEFHEFQTKKKRKEAKSIANAAKEEAKDQGMSDDQADAIFKEIYDEQMQRVKHEGVSALLTKEEQEREAHKRSRFDRNNEDHNEKRSDEKRERKKSRNEDSRKGRDDEDRKRRKTSRDEEERNRKTDRDKDRKSEKREERRERKKSERERRERKRDEDLKRESESTKRSNDTNAAPANKKQPSEKHDVEEPATNGVKSSRNSEPEQTQKQSNDKKERPGSRSRDRKQPSSRRDRDRGKDRDRDSDRSHDGRDKRDREWDKDRRRRDRDDRKDRDRDRDRESRRDRDRDRDLEFDRRPPTDFDRYGPSVREGFPDGPPMKRFNGPVPRERDRFGINPRGAQPDAGYYGPAETPRGPHDFPEGIRRDRDERVHPMRDDRGPTRSDRGQHSRDSRIPPGRDDRIPDRDRGPPIRDGRAGPPLERDVRGFPGDRDGRGGPHGERDARGIPGDRDGRSGPHGERDARGIPGDRNGRGGPHGERDARGIPGDRNGRGPHGERDARGAPGDRDGRSGPHGERDARGIPGDRDGRSGPHGERDARGIPGDRDGRSGPHGERDPRDTGIGRPPRERDDRGPPVRDGPRRERDAGLPKRVERDARRRDRSPPRRERDWDRRRR